MKVKCQFPKPTSGDLGDAMGIAPERMDEISDGLDVMVKKAKGIVYMSDMVSFIEDLCDTQEELIWAFTNHIQWLAATGRLVPSNKK